MPGEAEATETPAAAPQVPAEQAPAPAAPSAEPTGIDTQPLSEEQEWDAIVSKAMGDEPAQDTAKTEPEPPPDEAASDKTEQGDSSKEELKWPDVDAPKPKSKRERLFLRAAQQAEQAKVAPLQEQLQRERQQFEQQRIEFQQQQQALQQAIQKGDLDAYLKQAAGISIEDYTKRRLMEAGAQDPKVQEMEARLQRYEQQQYERQQQELQRQQQLQQQQQQQQDIAELRDELSKSGLPGIDKLAKLEGFTESVYRGIMEHGEDWLDAAAKTRQRYIQARDALNAALGELPAPSGVQTAKPTQPGAVAETNRGPTSPPTSLPQSDASDAGGTNLDDLSDEDAWDLIQKRAAV